MAPIRYVMIGGFLGAGKTTTIARLARVYQDRGLKVGIVTNDQASDLVDTYSLRSQGFEVGEVPGACFCCNFNELTCTVEQLSANERPDVVLAEPVGSCTDLVATVIQPLMRLFASKFEIAPYAVILKPSHGKKILKGDARSGFSPKAAYIFKKQLEEADLILLNRTDELSAEEADELYALLEKERPGVPILRMSAKTGERFDQVVEFLDQKGEFGRRILDLDYDVYAEGEAELGWLNCSVRVQAEQPFNLDRLLTDVVGRLRNSLAAEGAETAHLKTIGLHEGFYGVANLVSSDSDVDLSLPSHCETREANVIVNARVAVDPEVLDRLVDQALQDACQAIGAKVDLRQTQSFRPGRPVPTHRFASVS